MQGVAQSQWQRVSYLAWASIALVPIMQQRRFGPPAASLDWRQGSISAVDHKLLPPCSWTCDDSAIA